MCVCVCVCVLCVSVCKRVQRVLTVPCSCVCVFCVYVFKCVRPASACCSRRRSSWSPSTSSWPASAPPKKYQPISSATTTIRANGKKSGTPRPTIVPPRSVRYGTCICSPLAMSSLLCRRRARIRDKRHSRRRWGPETIQKYSLLLESPPVRSGTGTEESRPLRRPSGQSTA